MDAPGDAGLLGDLLVVEVAEEVAGPFAARLLADLGARCIKVESPGGDPSRAWGPFPDDQPDPDASAAFFAWNHGKESVELALDDASDAATLDALIERADVVVEDGRLDVSALRERFPKLVIVSVTPFGREGCAAGRPATDAVAYAMGGAMSSTGLPDREPHHLGGSLVQAQAGSAAAAAAVAGVLAAEAGGAGQWIDVAWVDVEAGSVDRAAPYLLACSYCGADAVREPARSSGLPGGVYRCSDGHVVVSTYGWTITKMLDAVGDPELDAVLRATPGNVYRPVGREALARILRAWFGSHTRGELTDLAQSRGWTVTPANRVLEVARDAYLREAGAVEDVLAGPLGLLTLPGPAFTAPGGPAYRRPSPRLGEHTTAILEELGLPGAAA